MKKSILGLIGGLLVWVIVASLLNRLLRVGFAGYATAELTMTFTLGMKVARLVVGALASLAAGAATGVITRRRTGAAWALGVVLLVAFIPAHIHLSARFPIWYHLVFLVALVPLVVLGAALVRSSNDAVRGQLV